MIIKKIKVKVFENIDILFLMNNMKGYYFVLSLLEDLWFMIVVVFLLIFVYVDSVLIVC